MSGSSDNLLARLAGLTSDPSGEDPLAALAARSPAHDVASTSQADAKSGGDPKLDSLLGRIHQLTAHEQGAEAARSPQCELAPDVDEPSQEEAFVPYEPKTLRDTGLSDSDVESLILKFLLARGDASGRDVVEQIRLPFVMVESAMRQMKVDQLVGYKSSAPMNDYIYQLTDIGRERARRFNATCTYFGAAPVTLANYIASVKAQSLEGLRTTRADLERAFQDLLINPQMLSRLGPAINSGRGMFLFGAPGNGKTSIAERVTSCFGKYIWIPRALGIDGDIIRVFDPNNHVEAPHARNEELLDNSRIDKRWIRIERPTIIAGGELTMGNLEVQTSPESGISEAPLQLKSNCGTLVIDDFGRQKMTVDELLNRWIVPLEKRYDFLNLNSGKKIEVPFDQLIVFSTNLEPKDLVDDAFLRRIPYKIEVTDPSEEEFRKLFHIMCPIMGFEHDQASVDHLISRHYHATGRPFRCCQPRDLLMQVKSHCLYEDVETRLTPEYFDFAAENYFAVM